MVKIKTCFPRSSIGSEEVDKVLSLITSFMMIDPSRRISVQEALDQKLFGGPAFYELEEGSPWKVKGKF